jgi:flagellar L-ring protein precursor FlgH
VTADSLYAAGKSRSMFADRKARGVGDVVTVLITESTVAVQDADASAQRSLDARADGGSDSWGLFKLVPRASLGGSVNHQGSGSTARTSKVVSSITCRVVDVTPAGQLVLKGERSQKVNADTETVKFSGIVRPDDVQPNNTVASGAVADAQIEVVGKGPISRHVKPGLLSRIFEFLF